MKKKILIFHPALAPYRVDFFNELAKAFNTSFYFNLENVADQKFDQKALKAKCLFNLKYLDKGFEVLNRSIRFGVLSIIGKEKPDIILCAEYGPITFLALFYRTIFNRGVKVYTMSDDSVDNSQSRKGLRKFFRNFLAKNLNGIILASDDVSSYFKANVSDNPKLLVLPIIHSEISFRNELKKSLSLSDSLIFKNELQNKKIVLFVGRLVEVKNILLLIKAIGNLNFENTKLVVVGEGPLEDTLKESAISYRDKIIFTGRKEGLELYAWYNLAHVFVLPSTYERFGAVVNEALLSGCKVVCSNLAGASTLINETNGRVFDPHNIVDLENCLKVTLNEIDLNHKDGFNLRESKMPFTFTDKVRLLISELNK